MKSAVFGWDIQQILRIGYMDGKFFKNVRLTNVTYASMLATIVTLIYMVLKYNTIRSSVFVS